MGCEGNRANGTPNLQAVFFMVWAYPHAANGAQLKNKLAHLCGGRAIRYSLLSVPLCA